MSGKENDVYTSVSIKGKTFQKIFNDKTSVEFEEFTNEEMNELGYPERCLNH